MVYPLSAWGGRIQTKRDGGDKEFYTRFRSVCLCPLSLFVLGIVPPLSFDVIACSHPCISTATFILSLSLGLFSRCNESRRDVGVKGINNITTINDAK